MCVCVVVCGCVALAATSSYYWHDLKALIDGRGNHPCIFQYDTFNEQDMMHDFNTSNVVKWVQRYDPTRLVDTDSGGPDNSLHVGDVDDLHVGGPSPTNPHKPSARQYMMDGEYGNLEFWIDGQCVPCGPCGHGMVAMLCPLRCISPSCPVFTYVPGAFLCDPGHPWDHETFLNYER